MISPDDTARGVHVTVSTAKKYLSVLVNTGLVSADLSLTSNLQCGKNQHFFSLTNEIFLLKLPPSAFTAILNHLIEANASEVPDPIMWPMNSTNPDSRSVIRQAEKAYERITGFIPMP